MADRRTVLQRELGSAEPYAVTPHDSNDLPRVSRAISWAGQGTLAVVLIDDTVVTIASGALNTGVMWPLRVKRINATGTTATGVMAYF